MLWSGLCLYVEAAGLVWLVLAGQPLWPRVVQRSKGLVLQTMVWSLFYTNLQRKHHTDLYFFSRATIKAFTDCVQYFLLMLEIYFSCMSFVQQEDNNRYSPSTYNEQMHTLFVNSPPCIDFQRSLSTIHTTLIKKITIIFELILTILHIPFLCLCAKCSTVPSPVDFLSCINVVKGIIYWHLHFPLIMLDLREITCYISPLSISFISNNHFNSLIPLMEAQTWDIFFLSIWFITFSSSSTRSSCHFAPFNFFISFLFQSHTQFVETDYCVSTFRYLYLQLNTI